MSIVMNARQRALMIRRMTPAVRDGFDRAITRLRTLARLNAVEGAITEGSITDVIRTLGISEARFLLDFTESVRESYRAAGQAMMDRFPPKVVNGRQYAAVFDIDNPAARRFLDSVAGSNITSKAGKIAENQRRAVQRALEAGAGRGDGPRAIALNIIGRIDRATGVRTGGVLGLTEQMAGFVESARVQLLSGDPAQMQAYLTRAKRDRRFDSLVNAAIRDGRPVAAADVNRITARYSDRLLQVRGEMIARTETQEAVGHAAKQSLQQAVDDGVIPESAIRRIWRSSGNDGRTRDSHMEMDGETVGLNEPFELPGGAVMFPGDSSLGADPKETINCRCRVEEDVDWNMV